MDYTENGYNQFLLKEVDVLIANKGLNDSDLGAKEAMTVGEILDKFPDIPVSLVLGDIQANSIAANVITGNMIQSLSISGKSIVADTGTIGGWTLGSTSLTASSGSVGISSATTAGDDIRFWAGNSTPSSAPFKVTEAGALTSASGTIGGWTVGASTITAGQVTLDSSGIITTGSASNYVKLLDETIRLYSSSTLAGSIYTTSGTGFYITASSGQKIVISAGHIDLSSGSPIPNLTIPNANGVPTGGYAGDIYIDTTNNRFYCNVSGTWKYAALT